MGKNCIFIASYKRKQNKLKTDNNKIIFQVKGMEIGYTIKVARFDENKHFIGFKDYNSELLFTKEEAITIMNTLFHEFVRIYYVKRDSNTYFGNCFRIEEFAYIQNF